MAKIVQTAGRNALGEFAPEFAHYNDDVLFGENWNNADIDVKTRSIITVVALMAQGITAPIIGATKAAYLDDAAGAFEVKLTETDIAYLEEMYVPHPIVGAVDKNPEQGIVLLHEKK